MSAWITREVVSHSVGQRTGCALGRLQRSDVKAGRVLEQATSIAVRAVDIDEVGGRDRAHAGAAVDLGDDEALLHEVPDGFADGAAARAERLRQGDLGKLLRGWA